MIQEIATHSVNIDLLTGNNCIDAGCRGFQFSIAMRDLGCKVLAYDLEHLEAPEGISFFNIGLSTTTGKRFYNRTISPLARHLAPVGLPVYTIDINTLFKDPVDVLKLDIEGEEYHILSDPHFQPVPRQISVEFHEHCHKQLHDEKFQSCVDNLDKHYVRALFHRYPVFGAGWNYWDTLWIRKDLAVK